MRLELGTLKSVGKIYVQVVVNTFCSLAFAKCYSSLRIRRVRE